MLKKILLAIVVLLVVIQFIKPKRNLSADHTHHISTKYVVPDNVNVLLQNACADCHSNETSYPWYANVQPSAWFLAKHVNEGKEHFNLSEFSHQKIGDQLHQLEEMAEMVEKKEMPLKSYTYFGLHPEAKITDAERQVLIDWAHLQMEKIKAEYPADSLVRQR